MALIYRAILEVGIPAAAAIETVDDHFRRWIAEKASIPVKDVVLTTDESSISEGLHAQRRLALAGASRGLSLALLEDRSDGELVKTNLTVLADEDRCWLWADLERWRDGEDVFDRVWLPHTPRVLRELLSPLKCTRGGTGLGPKSARGTRATVGTLSAQIIDPARKAPIVVVTPTTSESRACDYRRARDVAAGLNKRLGGIATVWALEAGATQDLSKALLDSTGSSALDVYNGGVRVYLPRTSADDHPGRHRLEPGHLVAGARNLEHVLDRIARPLQLAACQEHPPRVWRTIRARLLGIEVDLPSEWVDDYERLERELDEAREAEAAAKTQLAEAWGRNDELEREVDRLSRLVRHLERPVTEDAAESPAADSSAPPTTFEELVLRIAESFPHIRFPQSQWAHATALDSFPESGSWTLKTWQAFEELEAYASAKSRGTYTLGFHDWVYESGNARTAVDYSTESETTDKNSGFRSARTFPVDGELASTYMPAHIKLSRKPPAPRLHFRDDTGRSDSKLVQVGYLGKHLQNKSTT